MLHGIWFMPLPNTPRSLVHQVRPVPPMHLPRPLTFFCPPSPSFWHVHILHITVRHLPKPMQASLTLQPMVRCRSLTPRRLIRPHRLLLHVLQSYAWNCSRSLSCRGGLVRRAACNSWLASYGHYRWPLLDAEPCRYQRYRTPTILWPIAR